MSATSGSSSTTRMLKVMASSCHCGLPGTRQADREFGEFAGFAVDRDGAAMLLRDDVVADREAETGALTGRLGREERLKQLVPDFGRDAGAVVAHPDLDRLAQIAGRHLEGRAIAGLAVAAGTPGGGIKTVADEVQEHAGHLLRRQLDQWRSLRPPSAAQPYRIPGDRPVVDGYGDDGVCYRIAEAATKYHGTPLLMLFRTSSANCRVRNA